MTHKEHERFIKELCDNVRDNLLRHQYPEEWDGHELRVLIAERFAQSARMSTIRQSPQRKRAREHAKIKDYRYDVDLETADQP